MISVVQYSEKYFAAWDEFIRTRPEATVAHLVGWRRAIAEGIGHEPYYLVALDGSGVCGVLPLFMIKTWWQQKYLISMPWIDYGGILASSEAATAVLLAEAEQLARNKKAEFVEFRSIDRFSSQLPVRTDKVTFKLRLESDPEAVRKNLASSLQRHIRKATNSGLTVKFGGLEMVPEFYRVFSRKMHEHGTPVWSRGFFEATMKHLGNSVEMVHVLKNGQVLAGALLVSFAGNLYIPSIASYAKYLDYRPNHALYWEVIRRGCAQGYQWFDFGRSTIDSPTYEFKRRWVPQPTQLNWQYYLNRTKEVPAINPDNPKYRLLINLWKKMPLSVANLLGPRVVKNFP